MTTKNLYLLAGGILGVSLIIYYMRKNKTITCSDNETNINGECLTFAEMKKRGIDLLPLENKIRTPQLEGIELLPVEAKIKIADAETYKRYAESVRNQQV